MYKVDNMLPFKKRMKMLEKRIELLEMRETEVYKLIGDLIKLLETYGEQNGTT